MHCGAAASRLSARARPHAIRARRSEVFDLMPEAALVSHFFTNQRHPIGLPRCNGLKKWDFFPLAWPVLYSKSGTNHLSYGVGKMKLRMALNGMLAVVGISRRRTCPGEPIFHGGFGRRHSVCTDNVIFNACKLRAYRRRSCQGCLNSGHATLVDFRRCPEDSGDLGWWTGKDRKPTDGGVRCGHHQAYRSVARDSPRCSFQP